MTAAGILTNSAAKTTMLEVSSTIKKLCGPSHPTTSIADNPAWVSWGRMILILLSSREMGC